MSRKVTPFAPATKMPFSGQSPTSRLWKRRPSTPAPLMPLVNGPPTLGGVDEGTIVGGAAAADEVQALMRRGAGAAAGAIAVEPHAAPSFVPPEHFFVMSTSSL